MQCTCITEKDPNHCSKCC